MEICGKKLAEYSDNKTYFYAHDHLGGPAVVTDHTGAVAARYRYYPFGEEWITEGTKSERHRFTGAERDGESGLTYHGARHYAPGFGRWTSVDPVAGDTSNPQRLNRYGYVLNDPVNYVDRDGLEPKYVVVNRTYLIYVWGPMWVGELPNQVNPAAKDPSGRSGGPGNTSVTQKPEGLSPVEIFKRHRLGEGCRKFFGEPLLKKMRRDIAQVKFWRLYGSQEQTVAETPLLTLGEGPWTHETIGDYFGNSERFGALAALISTGDGRATPNIVLGRGYQKSTLYQKGSIIFHEMLHYSLDLNDIRISKEWKLVSCQP